MGGIGISHCQAAADDNIWAHSDIVFDSLIDIVGGLVTTMSEVN